MSGCPGMSGHVRASKSDLGQRFFAVFSLEKAIAEFFSVQANLKTLEIDLERVRLRICMRAHIRIVIFTWTPRTEDMFSLEKTLSGVSIIEPGHTRTYPDKKTEICLSLGHTYIPRNHLCGAFACS